MAVGAPKRSAQAWAGPAVIFLVAVLGAYRRLGLLGTVITVIAIIPALFLFVLLVGFGLSVSDRRAQRARGKSWSLNATGSKLAAIRRRSDGGRLHISANEIEWVSNINSAVWSPPLTISPPELTAARVSPAGPLHIGSYVELETTSEPYKFKILAFPSHVRRALREFEHTSHQLPDSN